MIAKNTANRPDAFQAGNVLVTALGHFMHDIYTAFLAPILPLLINRLGISYTLAGLLTVFQNAASLMNPFIGLLADRVSIRYLAIAAPAVTAVLMSFLPLSPSYAFLAIILLLVGISASCWHVPAPVIIRNVAGKKLGVGMSFFMLGGELARSIGPIVILGAISLWGIEGTYRLIPFGLAASFLLFIKLRNLPVRRVARPQSGGFVILQVFVRLKRLFLTVAGISFSRAIITRSLTAFLPTYMTNQGSSLWLSGLSLSLLELAGAAGVFIAGTASDKLGRRRMLLVVVFVTPPLMSLFLLTSGWWLLPVLVGLGLFSFASTPVTMALVQENAGDSPAAANGIYMTLNFAMGALAVFIVGLMSDWIGLDKSYWVCTVLALVGIPCVLLLPEGERGRTKQASSVKE